MPTLLIMITLGWIAAASSFRAGLKSAPVEDLIEANNNVALELREVLLALPAVEWDAEQYAEMFHIVEEEFDDEALLHNMLGLEVQPGDAWQTLRIGELKCLIALAGGDLELALDFAKWSVAFNASATVPSV